jgi:hypothetical protein
MQSWSFKNVNIFWERTPDPRFLRKLSMTLEINQKKLSYNYYASGKFLTLKFKFQVKSSDTTPPPPPPPPPPPHQHPTGSSLPWEFDYIFSLPEFVQTNTPELELWHLFSSMLIFLDVKWFRLGLKLVKFISGTFHNNSSKLTMRTLRRKQLQRLSHCTRSQDIR